MSQFPKHMIERDRRYHARLVVPKRLRPYLDGKTEVREPLGGDYTLAKKKLYPAVARLQHKIALAAERAAAATGKPIESGRYPLTFEEIAQRSYADRLVFDEEIRNADARYATLDVDDHYASRLRDGMAGKLGDDELEELVGRRIEWFRRLGNTTVERGSTEWRTLARAMCVSEYEALSRVAERHEGDWTGKPDHPLLANAAPRAGFSEAPLRRLPSRARDNRERT